MRADVVQDCGFDSAKTEIVWISFDSYGTKIWFVLFVEIRTCSSGTTGELIDDWAAGVAEREEPGDFVVGLARGVVACAAEPAVLETALGSVTISTCGLQVGKQGVAAGDDQANRGQFWSFPALMSFKKPGVNMAFQGVYRGERP